MGNKDLKTARSARKDEFYTIWETVEREMNTYLEYDPDVFRDKTILLPCDDPEWSNFTKFFALHFMEYGIKKLISTSYAPKSNNYGEYYQPTFFETNNPNYDKEKSFRHGRIFVLEQKDINKDGVVNIDDLQWDYLDGDGDFRGDEVTKLRDKADMIITNPPFSLFREFLAWIIEGQKEFSIIGNVNALTYKEVFPLIKENKIWLGPSISSGDREFRVPDSYPMKAAGQQIKDGKKYIRVKGVRWFTNIDHGRRHEPLQLMSMAHNLKYHPKKKIRENGYPKYDNYDAIEVSFTDAIPSDYDGIMGVPITFLDKYNPNQFEILGSQRWSKSDKLLDVYCGKVNPPEKDMKTLINEKETYDRIFICHRRNSS